MYCFAYVMGKLELKQREFLFHTLEFSEIDLSANDLFRNLKEKYEGITVELIKQIESHHLAAIILETPSDIEGMTPLELAFEYKLFF